MSRYDNPRLLVNTHVEQIFIPPHYILGSASSLRSSIDHVKANLASLRALKLSFSIEDLFVQKIVLDHLDIETLKIWEQQSLIDSVSTLDNLLDFVEQRARVLNVTPPSQPSAQCAFTNSVAGNSNFPFHRNNNFQFRMPPLSTGPSSLPL